jgi:hypothetical protein
MCLNRGTKVLLSSVQQVVRCISENLNLDYFCNAFFLPRAGSNHGDPILQTLSADNSVRSAHKIAQDVPNQFATPLPDRISSRSQQVTSDLVVSSSSVSPPQTSTVMASQRDVPSPEVPINPARFASENSGKVTTGPSHAEGESPPKLKKDKHKDPARKSKEKDRLKSKEKSRSSRNRSTSSTKRNDTSEFEQKDSNPLLLSLQYVLLGSLLLSI